MGIDARFRFLSARPGGVRAPSPESLPFLAQSWHGDSSQGAAGANQDIVLDVPELVDALVVASGDASPHSLAYAIELSGGVVRSMVDARPPVATVRIPLSGLATLDEHDAVHFIEAARPLQRELSVSIPACGADRAHTATPPFTGKGVCIGIIDAGVDVSHPTFAGRVAWYWDQESQNASPSVAYGEEFSAADLAAGRMPAVPGDGHGTHVASIACGSSPAGVAPDADLVVVRLESSAGTHAGSSTNIVDALQYVVQKAADAGRPVAINISLGANGGGHVGASPTEIAIDAFARRRGVAIIKSAGNEHSWDVHASGKVPVGSTIDVEVECSGWNPSPDILEVWYASADVFEVAIVPPGAPPTGFASSASPSLATVAQGNKIEIEWTGDPELTGDNLFTIHLSPGTSASLRPGIWAVRLRRTGGSAQGHFDMWIERGPRQIPSDQLTFASSSVDRTMTVSVPGTGRRVVTVAAYTTRANAPQPNDPIGAVCKDSGRGPTRFGRNKPDLAAPGEWVDAAQLSGGHDFGRGTSVAAAHVTGAAAVLLGARPDLDGDQARQVLARAASATVAHSHARGCGNLDVARSLRLAGTAAFPGVSVAVVSTRIDVTTDIPCAVELRAGTNRRRLTTGRADHVQMSSSAGTSHTFDLSKLASGSYFLEVVARTPDWETLEDNSGRCYAIQVP